MPVFDSQRRFENELQSWSVAEKATTEPLEATKLHNQLQGYSQRYKDLVVLHNKDRKEIWRANRIPKWLDRDPSDPLYRPNDLWYRNGANCLAGVPSDRVNKVPKLEGQENETGNEMTDRPEPDKTEAV